MLTSIRAFFWRISRLGRRSRAETTLDTELNFHLQMETEENLGRGMNPKEARRQALIALGGLDQTREACQDLRGIRWFNEFQQDVRYGIRIMARNRSITIIAIAVLALGIGSATTVYSVVDAALLRALPYPQPEQLVRINDQNLWEGRLRNIGGVSVSNLLAHRDNNPVLMGLAQYDLQSFKILGDGPPEFLRGAAVTANFFDLLQVRPFVGRAFSPVEEEPGSPAVVLLAYGVWQTRFAGSNDILGRTIRLDNSNYTIIGVTPPGFVFPSGNSPSVPSLFVTLHVKKEPPNRAFLTIGRLRSSVSIDRAQKVMSSLVKKSESAQGSTQSVRMQSLHELTVANFRATLLVLLGAVGLVLFIACVNVANLLLARVTQRQKEFAVRAALGAGTGRLVRQLLIESILLGVMGGVLGILMSVFAMEVLKTLRPPELPQLERVSLNLQVLGFALCISLATGLLFGLMPVRRILQFRIQDTLKANAQTLQWAMSRRSMSLLIISEVSLGMILVSGAGLLINSLVRLQNVPLGFERNQLLTGSISLLPPRYISPAQWKDFYQRLLGDLRALPGVEAAALASGLPLKAAASASAAGLIFDERPPGLSEADNTIPGFKTPDGTFAALLVKITPGYLQALGFRVVAGRFSTEQDSARSLPGIVISQTMARHLWPGGSPVGTRTRLGNRTCEIVGVVEDIKFNDLKSDFLPVVYTPFQLQPVPDMTFVIRAFSDPTSLTPAVRRRIADLDNELPVVLKTMEQQYTSELAGPRFYTLVFGLLGIVAMSIASGGVYGVISYTVNRRTQEIGVRMALGAQSRDVLRLVLGLGMTPAVIGIVLGLAGAAALTRFISSLLFGIIPTDPATFVTLAIVMALVALTACYVPARQATKVNPIQTIRWE